MLRIIHIEGRYPDYTFKLSTQATNSYVENQVKK
jgi:hypothetical protein